jgi:hypothetical protein
LLGSAAVQSSASTCAELGFVQNVLCATCDRFEMKLLRNFVTFLFVRLGEVVGDAALTTECRGCCIEEAAKAAKFQSGRLEG